MNAERLSSSDPGYALIRETIDGAEIVHIFGELDLRAAPELETLLETMAIGGDSVVLDFNACNYFDSSIIAVVIRTLKRLGERFTIVIPEGHPTRRILKICNLERILPIAPSL
ncbi:MAG: STAS domain-containing protein [Candidatus Eremiobacteraeota bacterium]|nr:STAS domain-containing protein [Candidatus Eremiobacteraeota bacterium]